MSASASASPAGRRHPWFGKEAPPRVLAHRGFVPPDSEGIVENSIAALAAAHAVGATIIESDCQLTADGVVVLLHDSDLRRVLGDPRRVDQLRLIELEELFSERGGIATVEQALRGFPTMSFALDAKTAAVSEPLGRAVAKDAERVLISSFSDARRKRALETARAAGGAPATSAGRGRITQILAAASIGAPAFVARALRGIDVLAIPERHRGVQVLTPRLLDAAHRHGVEVHVWTINDPDDMSRLLDAGVDGIITDRADLAVAVAASHRPDRS